MADPTVGDVIRTVAKGEGIPPELAFAVAQKESGIDINAPIGSSGEHGIFQIMPDTAKTLGIDPTNPAQNIVGGVKYLRQLRDRFGGDTNKMLQGYNGGPEHVDKGDVSPQAQAYASAVMADFLGRIRTQQSGGTAPPPAAAPQTTPTPQTPIGPPIGPERPAPPPTSVSSGLAAAGLPQFPVKELAQGFASAVAKGPIGRMGEMLRRRFPWLGAADVSVPEPTTPAQKVGAFLEPAAEFGAATELAGGFASAAKIAPWLTNLGMNAKAAVATAIGAESAARGAASYGMTKAQGGGDTAAMINAGLGAAGPVSNAAMQAYAGRIQRKAVQDLALTLTKGLQEKGPEIAQGIKTGAPSPIARDGVRIVNQAASDLLDLPVQASWGKFLTMLDERTAKAGQTLKDAIAGPLGGEMVFKQPIIDALDKLESESAQHLATIQSGDVANKVYDPRLFNAIKELKKFLNASGEDVAGYGPMISVRNLTDIKQTWDHIVYGLSTVGKVGVSPDVLLATAEKEATNVGANAIRDIFEQKAPTVAALNKAYSDAKRLQDLARKVYAAQPGPGKTVQYATELAGAAGGMAAGAAAGHPYIGLGFGHSMGRLLARAMVTPAWQTLKPNVKDDLARAIATDNFDVARKILAPLVQAKVSAESKTP